MEDGDAQCSATGIFVGLPLSLLLWGAILTALWQLASCVRS